MAASGKCVQVSETGLRKVLIDGQSVLIIVLRVLAFRMCVIERDE